jgi:hypothetical protein
VEVKLGRHKRATRTQRQWAIENMENDQSVICRRSYMVVASRSGSGRYLLCVCVGQWPASKSNMGGCGRNSP